jgi:hypothetical protein
LKNNGTCTWKTSYRVVLVSGDMMGGHNLMPLPREVAPGETIDLAMTFKAPLILGSYRGNWQIRNDKGEIFGTTATSNRPFWVAVRVETPTITGPAYDFVKNACSAQWFSGSGNLNCPGVNNDPNGFILQQSTSHLEDGTSLTRPSLLTAPENIFNGYIRGVYPSFKVAQGDRFRAIINCEDKATSCGVLFRVDYELADGIVHNFWAFGERYDGKYFSVDLDLSPLAGQDVRFVFTVLSLGPASGDRALWVEPRIVRPTPLVSSTPTP